jgi:dihydroflavonol-4-reductase
VKPILVTGASGFIGWHVARFLLERGYRIRALVRPGSAVRELDVATVRGDLRDASSLDAAVAGCGLVFHVAADYRLWARNPDELYRSNVDGTRNLLEAARRAGVERIVYTSTVGTIGVPQGGIGTEDHTATLEQMTGAYKRSKFLAELVALDYAASGMPVILVNPTAPVGDHDFKPTPTGRIILDFMAGRMPAYVDTGLNLVDVHDVAQGHWLACEQGRPGERYLLGAENLTLRQVFERLAPLCKVAAPSLRIPYVLAWMAGAASTAWARVSGGEPRVALDAVRMSRKRMWVSHEKASRELGYRPGRVDDALARAVEWFAAMDPRGLPVEHQSGAGLAAS